MKKVMDMVLQDGETEEEHEKKKKKKDASSSSLIRWEKFVPRMVLRVLLVEADESTRQIVAALLWKCSYRGSVPKQEKTCREQHPQVKGQLVHRLQTGRPTAETDN